MNLCQNCGLREASVHMTQIRSGEVLNRWLCPVCAQDLQLPSSADSQDLDSDFFAPGNSPDDSLEQEQESLAAYLGNHHLPWQNLDPGGVESCPVCGFKRELFARTAQLGCPGCYQAFAPSMKPLLARIHGRAIHLGKAPVHHPQGPNILAEMTRARVALEKAVTDEDFEEAARLRDRLKQMQKSLEEKQPGHE